MNKFRLITFSIFFIYITVVYLMFVFWETNKIFAWAREDGFFENLTAVCLFLTSIVLFILFAKDLRGNNFVLLKTGRNLFYLLLAFLFLFGALEEISWGQRIFGFGTPENMKIANEQQEFNLHNLKPFMGMSRRGETGDFIDLVLSTKTLRMLFWIGYGFLLPLLFRYSSTAVRFLSRINLPVPPLFVGVLLVWDYFYSKMIEYLLPAKMAIVLADSRITGAHAGEIRECNFAIFFFVATLVWFSEVRGARASKKSAV